jgi:hypothetical protein
MGMANDAAARQVVLFGGSNDPNGGTCTLGDTWTWDGTSWTEQHPSSSPAPRCTKGMAYDAARAVVVLFGGTDGYTNYADTWTWNGTDWTEQHPVTSPPAACCPGLSFDAATQRIVLLESYSMETWTWDGVNWTKENPPKSPPERDGGMGFARSGKHVVLFGGDTCPTDICWDWGDTWIWHWGTWTKQHPLHSPGGRCCGEMAYDVARGRTVLFGGDSPTVLLDDTWTWDGHD